MHGQVCCPRQPEIVGRATERSEMIAEPKRETHQDDRDKRKRQEKALDEALKNTFPASDPVSVEQPTPPAVDRAKTYRASCGRAI